MFYTYVLKNENDKIYIGQTSNIEDRIIRHNDKTTNNKTSFTHKNGGEWDLVYKEEFETRSEALKREKELKSYQGRKYIREIINKK